VAGSTVTTLLANTRLHLQEATAREWTDAQIITYISRSYLRFAAYLSMLKGSDWFQTTEDVTLAADGTTVLLTAFTNDLAAIKHIMFKETSGFYVQCLPFQEGDDFRLLYTTTLVVNSNTAPRYRLRQPDNIYFLPKSGAARTINVTYRYRPTALTTGSDTVATPLEYDDVIEYRAAILALADEGEKDPQFEGLLSERLAEIEEQETNTNAEAGTMTVKNVTTRHLFG